MKSFKKYLSEKNPEYSSLLDESPPGEVRVEEDYVGGAIVSAKLNSMKNQVLREKDPKKQNDIIAEMIHLGIGMIPVVMKDRRRK